MSFSPSEICTSSSIFLTDNAAIDFIAEFAIVVEMDTTHPSSSLFHLFSRSTSLKIGEV
jgi:hypothetical protein